MSRTWRVAAATASLVLFASCAEARISRERAVDLYNLSYSCGWSLEVLGWHDIDVSTPAGPIWEQAVLLGASDRQANEAREAFTRGREQALKEAKLRFTSQELMDIMSGYLANC